MFLIKNKLTYKAMSSASDKKGQSESSKHFDLDGSGHRKIYHDPKYIPNLDEVKLDDEDEKKTNAKKKEKIKRFKQKKKRITCKFTKTNNHLSKANLPEKK